MSLFGFLSSAETYQKKLGNTDFMVSLNEDDISMSPFGASSYINNDKPGLHKLYYLVNAVLKEMSEKIGESIRFTMSYSVMGRSITTSSLTVSFTGSIEDTSKKVVKAFEHKTKGSRYNKYVLTNVSGVKEKPVTVDTVEGSETGSDSKPVVAAVPIESVYERLGIKRAPTDVINQ